MTQHFQMILELHVGLKPILDGFGVGLNEVDVVLDGLDGDSSRHFAGAGLGFGLEEVFHLLEAQFICEPIFKKFLNKASSGNVLHLCLVCYKPMAPLHYQDTTYLVKLWYF